MRALTTWQPYASLIIAGAKPYEFRSWPAPQWIIARRIVIHAAARKIDPDVLDALLSDPLRSCAGGAPDLARRILRPAVTDPSVLPLGAGLGTAIVGQPRRTVDLFGPERDGEEIDPAIWAWPMLDPEPFPEPIPARVAQGFWLWLADAGSRC
jgi:hypothetical protein